MLYIPEPLETTVVYSVSNKVRLVSRSSFWSTCSVQNGLGALDMNNVYLVDRGRRGEGRRVGGGRIPNQKNDLESLCLQYHWTGVLTVCKAKNLWLNVWYEECIYKIRSFSREPLLLSVCQRRHSFSKAFTTTFAFCKWLKIVSSPDPTLSQGKTESNFLS